jgi:hypothetical protein
MNRPSKKEIKAALDQMKNAGSSGSTTPGADHNSGGSSSLSSAAKKGNVRYRKKSV